MMLTERDLRPEELAALWRAIARDMDEFSGLYFEITAATYRQYADALDPPKPKPAK